ncbi:MAG: hypothetical protein DRO05_05100 [Thermoproteota archaeon]|nr:MAG: hypothetical protein DRO05_05100 [Candidatus Korarchaeota archaeon]
MLQIHLARKGDFIKIIKECLSETRGRVILFWKEKGEDGKRSVILLVPIFYPNVGEWIIWCYCQELEEGGPEDFAKKIAYEAGITHVAEVTKISANGEELDL